MSYEGILTVGLGWYASIKWKEGARGRACLPLLASLFGEFGFEGGWPRHGSHG